MHKGTSREKFTEEYVGFSNDSGCRIKRWQCMFICILFIGCLTGIIVLAIYLSRSGECSKNLTSTTNPTQETNPLPTIPEKIDYRLPRDVTPQAYIIHMQPFLEKNKLYFIGEETITILCHKATNQADLHSRNLNINDVKILSMEKNCLSEPTVVGSSEELSLDRYIINLSQELEPNKTYKLNLKFKGSLINPKYKGFYLSEYKDDLSTSYLAATQFQTTNAREAFPCFDEPGLKAKFTINIRRPAEYSSLSNMELLDSTDEENGWFLDRYEESPPMSTYLVAFVVSKFVSHTKSTPQFSVWSQPALVEQTEWSLEIGQKILNQLGLLFNMTSPLNKTDMIAIPDFAPGAMENWGLVAYRESYMIYDKLRSPIFYKKRVASTVAHELNHYWFGNLLSPDEWSEAWLSEGFASYFVYNILELSYPNWKDKYVQYIHTDDCYDAFQLDAVPSATPLKYDVNTNEEISGIFNYLTYRKGACFLYMVENVLGKEKFILALQNYFKDNAYGSVNQDILLTYLTDKSITDLQNFEQFFNDFSLKPGYPLVTLTIKPVNETYYFIKASQERFYLNDNGDISDSTIWHIPLTLTSSANDIYWLENKESTFFVEIPKQECIIGNNRQTGYYKVNYDDSQWETFYNDFNSKEKRECAKDLRFETLLSDSLILARAGKLNYTHGLKFLQFLNVNLRFVPWYIASKEINILLDQLQNSEYLDKFKEFIRLPVNLVYSESVWNTHSEDTTLEGQLLDDVIVDLACALEIESCIDKSKEMYNNWIKNGTYDFSLILFSTAICTTLKYGTDDNWYKTYEKYINSKLPSEQIDLLMALTCSRQPSILKFFMLKSADKTIVRPQNAYIVFQYIALNKNARYLYLDFLKELWNELEKKLGAIFENAVPSSLTTLATGFNSDYDIQVFESFKKNVSSKYEKYFDNAIEVIKTNARWSEKYEKEIGNFLENYDSIVPSSS